MPICMHTDCIGLPEEDSDYCAEHNELSALRKLAEAVGKYFADECDGSDFHAMRTAYEAWKAVQSK